MFEARPTFGEFKNQLEQPPGQTLASQAEEAAKDFWDCWDSFETEIARCGLSVQVDALRLSLVFPEYKRYHVWKGAGKVLFVVGVVVLWFDWRISAALLAAGAVIHGIGNWYCFNDARQFAENLMKEATLRAATGGFAGLCANYIAGTIQLATAKGMARWPQHASNALTGRHTLVAT